MSVRVDLGRRVLRPRAGRLQLLLEVRPLVVSGTLGALSVATLLVVLTSGDYTLTLGELARAVAVDDGSFDRTVVLEWRMPRALAAPLYGGALALSGLVFQRLTRNPLASPDIIGFGTGAYTGALVALTVLGGSLAGATVGALAGGLATAVAVLVLARGGGSGSRLIVVGIAVSAALGGVNTWLLKTAGREQALTATVWGSGSLKEVTGTEVALTAAAVGAVGLVLARHLPRLAQLELGDEVAAAQGVPVPRTRIALVVCSVALMALVTAVAGPISFVALVAPPIAARLTGSVTAGWPAGAVGALLLAVADALTLLALPTELPVGLVTPVVGGAYLVHLLVRGRPGRVA
ncbi:MAG: FecCD family ABC transporter permease [Actinomycetaceae bacterium]